MVWGGRVCLRGCPYIQDDPPFPPKKLALNPESDFQNKKKSYFLYSLKCPKKLMSEKNKSLRNKECHLKKVNSNTSLAMLEFLDNL